MGHVDYADWYRAALLALLGDSAAFDITSIYVLLNGLSPEDLTALAQLAVAEGVEQHFDFALAHAHEAVRSLEREADLQQTASIGPPVAEVILTGIAANAVTATAAAALRRLRDRDRTATDSVAEHQAQMEALRRAREVGEGR